MREEALPENFTVALDDFKGPFQAEGFRDFALPLG